MKKDVFEPSDQYIRSKLMWIEAGILTILVVHIVALLMLVCLGW